MEKVEGKKVFGGIAIGKIFYYEKERGDTARRTVEDAQAEVARYERAREDAIKELHRLHDKAVAEVGEEGAQIFEVHAMMLEDDDYNDSVRSMITGQQVNAEYAVAVTGEEFAVTFANMEDEYFRARSADVKDVSERVVNLLNGAGTSGDLRSECILMAEDLAPSETLQMDKAKLMAFVTRLGSVNSHTAILARTMGIPALVKVEIDESWNDRLAIVDGYDGTLIIDPDEATLREYERLREKESQEKKLLQELKGRETVTRSGRKIKLYANIGSVSDLETVLQNDAEGIGLFRSEFLYLEKDALPTEEEQFRVYRQVAEKMAGRRVIIRTLDIGADKQVAYFNLGKEDNPAMGYRAIRICLSQPDIFKTQLRAIYRAGAFGNVSVMYPMITSVEEVREIKKIVQEVKQELDDNGVSYGKIEQGIMIETPAAALISDLLAKEVDFFSVGTNDLTQYTLAVDRQNSRLDRFYDPHHEAILRMLRMVTENAHKAGIWAGICGELGADIALTEIFLKMGIDELSVSPGMILPLRRIIRESEG